MSVAYLERERRGRGRGREREGEGSREVEKRNSIMSVAYLEGGREREREEEIICSEICRLSLLKISWIPQQTEAAFAPPHQRWYKGKKVNKRITTAISLLSHCLHFPLLSIMKPMYYCNQVNMWTIEVIFYIDMSRSHFTFDIVAYNKEI